MPSSSVARVPLEAAGARAAAPALVGMRSPEKKQSRSYRNIISVLMVLRAFVERTLSESCIELYLQRVAHLGQSRTELI